MGYQNSLGGQLFCPNRAKCNHRKNRFNFGFYSNFGNFNTSFIKRGIFASIFFVKKNEDIQINIKYFKIYLYNEDKNILFIQYFQLVKIFSFYNTNFSRGILKFMKEFK